MAPNKIRQLFFFLSIIAFFLGLLYFINNDFWQDEIYSVYHFVFVPAKTTITDYHTTNNHILFSLILNLYRTLFGFQQISVLNQPWLLRIIPFIISVINVITLFKLSEREYGRTTAVIVTSLGQQQFVFQIFRSNLEAIL